MSSGDPNFTPSSKGDFAIDPRGYPKRHRMVAGRIITEELVPRHKDALADIDELMAGVSSSDLRGPATGFSRFANEQKRGAAGSGETDESLRRSRHTDYSNANFGGDAPIDQGWETTEDVGESDLLGQPQEGHGREEFGDLLDDEDNEQSSYSSPNQFDNDDLWSIDILDEFDEDRAYEPQPNKPATFSGRPHRQREAAVEETLVDELDKLFDSDSATFNRRGL